MPVQTNKVEKNHQPLFLDGIQERLAQAENLREIPSLFGIYAQGIKAVSKNGLSISKEGKSWNV